MLLAAIDDAAKAHKAIHRVQSVPLSLWCSVCESLFCRPLSNSLWYMQFPEGWDIHYSRL